MYDIYMETTTTTPPAPGARTILNAIHAMTKLEATQHVAALIGGSTAEAVDTLNRYEARGWITYIPEQGHRVVVYDL